MWDYERSEGVKVKSEKFAGLVYSTECRTCHFGMGIAKDLSSEKIRRLSKKHVKETGHSVLVVYGGETEYSPDVV